MRLCGGGCVRARAIALMLAATLACANAAFAGPPANAAAGSIDTERVFRAAARLYGLDPDLLAAIAAAESGGDADAVSPKGAIGLMQLMPSTALRFGINDPFDPVSNTLGAARFLSYLRSCHIDADGAAAHPLTLTEMLAAYNAGPGAVDKYGGVPPYRETREYVRRVLITYLLGGTHDHLGAHIRSSAPAARPVAAMHDDPLTKLADIRRARALAIERARHGTTAAPGEAKQ
jgi:soluble lytic murein transglycosylase-like protein